MTAGLSRKAKRKQEREDKKRHKFKQQRKEIDKTYPDTTTANKMRGKKPAKASRSSGFTNKFHEFLTEAANSNSVLSAEDKEIRALEAKLGLGSSSASKSASARERLKKEFSKDGLGEDFADFLSELDNISEVVKRRPKVTNISGAHEAGVEIGSGASEAGSEGENDCEMDDETRQEMELLQAEDANFLKGMDELPTDESESESEDLAQFNSNEEESEDDTEARVNALRNQQLAAINAGDISDESDDRADQILEADSGREDQLEEIEDSEDDNDIEESNRDVEKDEAQEEEMSVVVGEDIYGRTVIKSRDGSKKTSTYLPPHLRRKFEAQVEAAAATASADRVKRLQLDEQVIRELTRRINGQLNRISESNMESIVLEMERIYREYGRSHVNEILLDKLIQITCHPRQVMTPLIKVGGALVAALYHSVGSEVGGFFVEKLTRKLIDCVEEEKKNLNKSADKEHDDEHEDSCRTSKVPVNLTLYLMMLYNFGVVHCSLVYDLFRSFVDSFSSTDIELIHQLLKIGGAQLRSDDADALRQMVAAVQQKVGEVQERNGGNQLEERVRFILDLIYSLKKSSTPFKGGKSGTNGENLDVSPLKKWLGRVKSRCGNANNPLRVSLQELLNADEDGRWWIVGGTWVGHQRQHSTSDEVNDDANTSTHEQNRLLQLAEKQHMNTDVRKKIFVALMGATDCYDAYERLMQLHLKERQEREIVRVILHCCGQESIFNRFYLVLAEKLCEMDPRYKFTLQLAFWDIFKKLTSLKPRGLFNQAQMLAGLVLSSTLSLSCLKVLDFTQLEEKSVFFLRVLMEEILKVESEVDMAQIFNRLLQTKKAQLTIDGLAIFFHQHMTSFRIELDQKTRTLMTKRAKSVRSLLDHLAKTAASAESEARYM